MKLQLLSLAIALTIACLAAAGCAGAPAAAPTAAPAKPAAQPTSAVPARAAEPTKAPAAAQPAAAPTKAAAAQPTAVPAKKVDYPQKGKAITMIVPWPPGNSNDIMGRLLAGVMEKEFGTPVEVVNKAGASTQVGMTDLARAKPDGYTLAVNSMPTTSLVYLDPERKAAFGRKDFQPIAVGVVDPTGFAVKADGPHKTMKDLVDAGKAAPKKIKVGTNGFMTPTHMVGVKLQKETGAQFALVHFDGAPLNVSNLMGDHTEAAIAGPGGTAQFVKSGELRVLGITDTVESKFLPGVKPLRDQGYDIVTYISRGIVAPAGTPKETVDILAAVVKKATEDSEFRRKMEDSSVSVRYMGPEEYAKHWDELDAQAQAMLDEIKAEQAKK